MVEHLAAAKLTGNPLDAETARRVADLPDALAERLAAVGLIPQRERATLGPFLDSYISDRGDVKRSTVTVYRHTRRCLVEYFGAEKPLREITAGDADAWRLWLMDHEKLADNTVRRRSGIAKQSFKTALRRKLIAENPFADLVAAVRRNEKRFYFVTREETEKVLDACPDVQWRLIVALARYGGLRCPSEVLGLTWRDIDWEHSRIRVPSPKTEHHPGGEARVVPLFPELRPHLEAAFEQAEPGDVYPITRYRDLHNQNLRSRLLDIIWAAGLCEWPKLFQNMRSSRQTELAESFPMHVVCGWMGNSQPVAAKHYLQTTEEHFAKAVQNPVQQPSETGRNDRQGKSPIPCFSGLFENVPQCANVQVGVAGLEPAASTL